MSNIVRHQGEPLTIRLYEELYVGGPLTPGKIYHVANKGDLVFRLNRGMYSVTNVTDTGIPTLDFQTMTDGNPLDGQTKLYAGLAKMTTISDSWLTVNYAVEPAVATVDTRFLLFGTEVKTIKAFLGTDLDPATAKVISARYNNPGGIISEAIEIYRVTNDGSNVYRPYQFNVPKNLKEKQIVTIVGYNELGGAVSADTFLVRHSDSIAPASMSKVYTTGIELLSSLITTSNKRKLINTLGVPPRGSLMQCRVYSSDGSHVDMPIDGTKIKLEGLESFNYKSLGAPGNLSLIYYPDEGEAATNLSASVVPNTMENYIIQNSAALSQFALKLYVVPHFINKTTGYKLKYYLTDDAYGVLIDVTTYMEEEGAVKRANNEGNFLPLGYGIPQQLVLRLDVDKVFRSATGSMQGLYPGYIQIQTVLVTLNNPEINTKDRWRIDYNADGANAIGENQKAQYEQQNRLLHIKGNNTTFFDFMENSYWKSLPAYDPKDFSKALLPTHFRITTPTFTTTMLVEEWDKPIPIPPGASLTEDTTLMITWIADGGTELYLAVTAISLELLP